MTDWESVHHVMNDIHGGRCAGLETPQVSPSTKSVMIYHNTCVIISGVFREAEADIIRRSFSEGGQSAGNPLNKIERGSSSLTGPARSKL